MGLMTLCEKDGSLGDSESTEPMTTKRKSYSAAPPARTHAVKYISCRLMMVHLWV